MNSDSRKAESNLFNLIKEASPPKLPRIWTDLGYLWALMFVSRVFGAGHHLHWFLLVGILLAILMYFIGKTPLPRRNNALSFYLFLLLAYWIFVLFNHSTNNVSVAIQLSIGFLIVFVLAFLIRRRADLWITWVLAVAVFVITINIKYLFNFWDSTGLQPKEEMTVLLLLLIFSLPVVSNLKGWLRVVGWVVLVVIFSSMILPFLNLENSDFHLFSWRIILLALIAVILSSPLIRESVKDFRRWKEPNIAHSLYRGGISCVFALPLFIILLGREFSGEFVFNYAAVLGIALAGRERLIFEDFTRQPQGRGISLKGHIQEIALFFHTMTAVIFRESDLVNPNAHSSNSQRQIDSTSDRIYFPYKSGKPNWVPVCMHLHTNHWEGHFSADEVVEYYAHLGAKAAIITDHNRITTTTRPESFLPAYESGWGAHNHHVLVLGAKRTLPDPDPAGTSPEKRSMHLKNLRNNGEFLILAHPMNKYGWSKEDVETFDYDAVEIFNKSIVSVNRWDEALSSGKLVWGTAGDDNHDLRSRHQTGKRYILVDIRGKDIKEDGVLIEALRSGSFISVWQQNRDFTEKIPPDDLPMIAKIKQEESSLILSFDRKVDQVSLFGNGGKEIESFDSVDEALIRIPENEGYIRAEIIHEPYRIALNPILRIK
ncbi:hypothetical protein ACFLQJ_00160 [Calditrichota bacterium]